MTDLKVSWSEEATAERLTEAAAQPTAMPSGAISSRAGHARLTLRLMLGLIAVAMVSISIASAPGPIGVLGGALALVTLAIAVIDARRFIIPDALSAAGFCLALAHAAVQEPYALTQVVLIAVIRGATLALAFAVFRGIYARLRGRQGLGLGDVKLAGVAGAWLDWSMMPIAVEIAAVVALSAYVLRRALSGRSVSAISRIPFGLFFAPAIWACWLIETIWLAQF